jgi:hypothetical protein
MRCSDVGIWFSCCWHKIGETHLELNVCTRTKNLPDTHTMADGDARCDLMTSVEASELGYLFIGKQKKAKTFRARWREGSIGIQDKDQPSGALSHGDHVAFAAVDMGVACKDTVDATPLIVQAHPGTTLS